MKILRFVLAVPLVLFGLVVSALALMGNLWLMLAALAIWATLVAVMRTDVGVVVGLVAVPLLAAVVIHFGSSIPFSH